jgi:hypothetical protein
MAHEPCEEASRPKHGKKNIAWCGVDGGTCWARELHQYSDIPSGIKITSLSVTRGHALRVMSCSALSHG